MDKLIISGTIGQPSPEMEKMLEGSGIGKYFTAQEARDFIAQNQDGPLVVEIDSIGGDVVEGFEIYDALVAERNKGREVVTIGKQYHSIASIIFLAGNVRKHVSNSKPLIHNSWQDPSQLGNIQLNSEMLAEIKAMHDEADSQLLHEYVAIAGRDRWAEIKDLMSKDALLSDKQVLDLNFATEVIASGKTVAFIGKALAFNSKALAGMVIYADAVVTNAGKVFMIQRGLSDDLEPGKWAFPGGKVEPGEDPIQAAVRELQEETGLILNHPSLIDVHKNSDGSITFYVHGEGTGDFMPEPTEVEAGGYYSQEEVEEMDIIFNQHDRYKNVLQKSDVMSEKVNERLGVIETTMAKLFGLFKASVKAMLLPLADGQTELYVFSEDDELPGKRAVLAEDGNPTETPAPEGTHPLNDGREIVIGADGVIQSVSEATVAMTEDEMTAQLTEMEAAHASAMEEKEAEVAAVKAQLTEQSQINGQLKEGLEGLKAEFDAFKEEVPGDKGGLKAKGPVNTPEFNREEWNKMKPSERLLLAAKARHKKN